MKKVIDREGEPNLLDGMIQKNKKANWQKHWMVYRV